MALPATTRVLRIPELLSRIFSFSTTKDNGQNLLVVTEATHLYHVLAPLERTKPIRFTRQLMPEDWVRFDRYAWRIKSLDISLRNIDISLYGEITASRNRLDFLPNLRTLSIPGITIAVQLFAHANITSFTVHGAHGKHEIKGTPLLSQIRHKMPNLHSLSINISSPSALEEIRSQTSLTLRELKKLSYLALPPAWITDCATKTISELPDLHTLDICLGQTDPPESLDIPPFSTNLNTSSFPKLTNLSTWISFSRAAACFGQAFQLPSFEVLELYATPSATREELKHLIAIIGDSCVRVTTLRLEGARVFFADRVSEGLGLGFEFQDLEPLRSCKHLTQLRIVHNLPFNLNASEIVKLLEPLQSLTDLYLNPMPRIPSPSAPPISCLSSIASARPLLSTLGLYMSTSSLDLPTAGPMATFKSLRLLHVGYSQLAEKDVKPVTFYLGHILPRDCTIGSFEALWDDPVLQSRSSRSAHHWEIARHLARQSHQVVDNETASSF
ncbi:hypothetical protein ONZ45_g19264 [Pleurotus djamor]|nr:hypothetical protein ONZ45_g19264 [Pleurotus djamor]